MTTPDAPRDVQPAGTGWPSAPPPIPPVVQPDPTPTPGPASEAPSEDAPRVVGRNEEQVAASEAASVDAPPVVGRNEEEEEVAAESPTAPRQRSPLRSGLVLALLLTTLLMAVATGFVWYQVHRHDATESARRAGLEASRDAARVLFSYDYRTLAKDFSAGRAVTTGKFAKQYADTTSKVVTPVAGEKKAVVKAEVVTAGVVRATPHTVVTIVYVNQVTTSSLASGPKVDLSRVRMTLTSVGGRWLVSNVEAL